MTEYAVESLLAEILDSEAREADYRNRAEVAEAKLAAVEKWRDELATVCVAPDTQSDVWLWTTQEMAEELTHLTALWQGDDENINPKVYKVEDGHPWKQSQWPSLRDAGLCDLCTAPEHLHMQETS